jgi:NAD(P)-dependent dehydrogenase (short-subunit alcohol dehydrogenase family)
MNLGIEGKIAFVTGGAQGIGASITKALADEGAKVVFTTRSAEEKERVSAETGATGILVGEHVEVLQAQILAADILVNNAGSTLSVMDPDCSLMDSQRVMSLNYEFPRMLVAKVLPRMRDRGWGRIVNLSSCSGLEQRGPIAYSAAKSALTAYTRSMGLLLAKESPGVVMTAVFPGVIFTKGGHWDKVLQERPEHAEKYLREQVPCARFGKPAEIAPLVTFLCSQHASYMHGALVSADGGLSKHFWNQVAA